MTIARLFSNAASSAFQNRCLPAAQGAGIRLGELMHAAAGFDATNEG